MPNPANRRERRNQPLAIARAAARLFLDRGVAATSGQDIAAAAGVSVRTVWRQFGTKERCVAPVLSVSIARFARVMESWPDGAALETHLRQAMPVEGETAQVIEDGVLAVRLVALAQTEPDIRTVWLESYDRLEADLLPVVASRCNRSDRDFEVRLCAATIAAAIRVVDERVSAAAIGAERHYTPGDLVEIMAGAIRDAATLPICDPVPLGAFGARSPRQGKAA
jgi:AcrR family transcriptional regulator